MLGQSLLEMYKLFFPLPLDLEREEVAEKKAYHTYDDRVSGRLRRKGVRVDTIIPELGPWDTVHFAMILSSTNGRETQLERR